MKQFGCVMSVLIVWLVTGVVATATPPATSAEIIVSQLDNEQHRPQIAFNWHHGEYLVVWHNQWNGSRDIYARRIDRFGRVLSWFAVNVQSNDSMWPAVAYNPTNDEYLVVWMYDFAGDGSDWDLHARRIPWNGPSAALPEFEISHWASNQFLPQVAWSDTSHEYLVVWSNLPASGPGAIDAQRVNPSGVLLGSAFEVAAGPEHRFYADIAYNHARNEYLVAYDCAHASTDVCATRLAVNGVPLGAEMVVAGGADNEDHAAVAASAAADGYVVTWQTWNPERTIYARALHGDGSFILPPLLIADSALHNAEPDVACDPNLERCLIAWMGQYSNLSGPFGIFARTIDFSGFIGDVALVRALYTSEDCDTAEPTIAAAQLGWMVAWEHRRDGASYWDIHGRMVWQVFVDGFESGSTGRWSAVFP